MTFNQFKQKGFTLIELLVVIAIIGLLASVVLTSLSTARAKARDARRMQDLRNIQQAFEIYFSTYERYPPESLCIDTSVGSNVCVIPDPPQASWDPSSDLQDLVTEGIFSQLPVDPINNDIYYYYYEPDQSGQGTPPCQLNSCRWYLCARFLESTGANYCVYSINQGP